MQKINLKKTTKDKLYAMLCELQNSYERLEEDSMKRIDLRNDELAEVVEQKARLNDELIRLNVERQGLLGELEAARQLADDRMKDITFYHNENAELKKIIYYHDAHPWKHLWRCIR